MQAAAIQGSGQANGGETLAMSILASTLWMQTLVVGKSKNFSYLSGPFRHSMALLVRTSYVRPRWRSGLVASYGATAWTSGRPFLFRGRICMVRTSAIPSTRDADAGRYDDTRCYRCLTGVPERRRTDP